MIPGMDEGGPTRRGRFWLPALLWLPAGAAAGMPTGKWPVTLPVAVGSLAVLAPGGLPLAFGCRRLWRLGYRRAAWAAGIGLGAAALSAPLAANLTGAAAIGLCSAVLGLPPWAAWWWLVWRG